MFISGSRNENMPHILRHGKSQQKLPEGRPDGTGQFFQRSRSFSCLNQSQNLYQNLKKMSRGGDTVDEWTPDNHSKLGLPARLI
jgi:hypothetical protein